MENKLQSKKGQMGGGTVSFVIGIVIVVIVVALVGIPIINDAITNLTGVEATILGVVGTLLAVLVISLIARVM